MSEALNSSRLVCGIEIHVELATASKMFCGCSNNPFYAESPNIYTCPVCLGMPGGLPVANKKAVEWTMRIGLALGCEIALFSKFDRKHYFYPDLPKGYQISQYDQPLCVHGVVETSYGPVRISRVHLEEDTGKLIHQEIPLSSFPHSSESVKVGNPSREGKDPGQARMTILGKNPGQALRQAQGIARTTSQKVSLIDFNRSGVPLVEIVTEPDIHSSAQAKEFTKKIAQIIKMLEVSSADMEKGSMRLEANISVRKQEQGGEELPPYKVEVKNLNSFRYIERAIEYEVKRQSEIVDRGAIPVQETRGWNESKGQTFPQRSKESAEDYRYFPDPDLPPLRFSPSEIDEIRRQLPSLPDAYKAEWVALGMKPQEAEILAGDAPLAWVTTEILKLPKLSVEEQLKIVTQWVNKKISIDLLLLEGLKEKQGSKRQEAAATIARTLQDAYTALVSVPTLDHDELSAILQAVLAENPKAVAEYKAGKTQVLGFLIGMCSRKIGGKVDPTQLRDALTNALA